MRATLWHCFYSVEMTFSVPLASGRDADVFAIDAGRVLRRYRGDIDVAAEAAVMTYLAEHGFPVPTVYHAAGADLVMQRVPGPTLLTALLTGEIDIPSAAGILAELHRRLHRIPARASRDLRVLHLDLHPGNVLLGPAGPILIDWRNSADGAPDLDTAMTALIIAQVAVGDQADLLVTAHALLTAFLDAVDGQPLRDLRRAVAMRGADTNLTHRERTALPQAEQLVRGGRA